MIMLICVICNEECELELLETAHLIPRCGTSNEEKYDPNIVEFFCLFCHKFYDADKIGILNDKIQISILKNIEIYYNIIYNNIIIMINSKQLVNKINKILKQTYPIENITFKNIYNLSHFHILNMYQTQYLPFKIDFYVIFK